LPLPPLRHYAIAMIIDIAYAIDDAMLTLLLMPLMPCHTPLPDIDIDISLFLGLFSLLIID
jgi:hypothetical protein